MTERSNCANRRPQFFKETQCIFPSAAGRKISAFKAAFGREKSLPAGLSKNFSFWTASLMYYATFKIKSLQYKDLILNSTGCRKSNRLLRQPLPSLRGYPATPPSLVIRSLSSDRPKRKSNQKNNKKTHLYHLLTYPLLYTFLDLYRRFV